MAKLWKLKLTAFVVFSVAVLLHVAAFSSAFWFKRRDIYGWLVHHGLWILCDYYRSGGLENKCLKLVNRHDNFENGKLSAVQALMCIALIINMILTVLFTVWLCCSQNRMGPVRSKRIGLLAFVLCCFSGILTAVSITIFGVHYAKFENVLNWSYILATISGGMLLIEGILGGIALLRWSPTESVPESNKADQRQRLPLPPVNNSLRLQEELTNT